MGIPYLPPVVLHYRLTGHLHLPQCYESGLTLLGKQVGILNTFFNKKYLANRQYGKWSEPRGISYLFGVIVRVKVVFRKTIVGD